MRYMHLGKGEKHRAIQMLEEGRGHARPPPFPSSAIPLPGGHRRGGAHAPGLPRPGPAVLGDDDRQPTGGAREDWMLQTRLVTLASPCALSHFSGVACFSS